jgi:hypothetical protein
MFKAAVLKTCVTYFLFNERLQGEEAASISETSINLHQTTRRNNPEDRHLHKRCRENLKCQETLRVYTD